MFKKITAILFILLANIFMLAHAVTPHSHTSGHVNLINLHGDHEHKQSTDKHSHNQNGDKQDKSEYCTLKQAVFITTNNNRIEPKLLDIFSNRNVIGGFQSVLLNVYSNLSDLPYLCSYYQKQYLLSLYGNFVSKHSCLRAPPTV